MSYILSLISSPASSPFPLKMFSYTPKAPWGTTSRANTGESKVKIWFARHQHGCMLKGRSPKVPTAKRSPTTAGSTWIARSSGEPCQGLGAPTYKLERSRCFPPKIPHFMGGSLQTGRDLVDHAIRNALLDPSLRSWPSYRPPQISPLSYLRDLPIKITPLALIFRTASAPPW